MFKKTFIITGLILLLSVIYAQEGWFVQNSGTSAYLMDLYFADSYTGWAVGAINTILHTTDGGNNWFPQSPPPSVNYCSVHFTDDQKGFAVGSTVGGSGRIRHTTDGGNTWDSIPATSAYSLWNIYFTDANNGWIVGGREPGFNIDPIRTIHHTNDGGYNWNIQLYEYNDYPLHCVHFVDTNTGCAVGEGGAIFWTTDGGNNWIEQTSGTIKHLWGIYLTDAFTGWAVGINGTILRTTDAGNNWIAQNADTSQSYGDVYFSDANNGWIAGSTILHTSDGGTTWNAQIPDTLYTLRKIYFTDADTGWAVGYNGVIIHTTTVGTSIIEYKSSTQVPTNLHLAQNVPNPFKQKTIIHFHLPRADHVTLKIFDIIGQEVKTLVDSELEAGAHSVVFNAKSLPNGVYFYRLNTSNQIKTKRLILLK